MFTEVPATKESLRCERELLGRMFGDPQQYWVANWRAPDWRWMRAINSHGGQLHPRSLASVRSHQTAHVPSRTAHAIGDRHAAREWVRNLFTRDEKQHTRIPRRKLQLFREPWLASRRHVGASRVCRRKTTPVEGRKGGGGGGRSRGP